MPSETQSQVSAESTFSSIASMKIPFTSLPSLKPDVSQQHYFPRVPVHSLTRPITLIWRIYSLLAILRVARHVLSLSLGTCCSFYQECSPYFTLHIHMATFLSSFKGTVSVSFLLALSKMYTSKPLSALFYHLRTT